MWLQRKENGEEGRESIEGHRNGAYGGRANKLVQTEFQALLEVASCDHASQVDIRGSSEILVTAQKVKV
jgi:hypothetical protein